jgi:uncharacterized protein (TIGR03086 family)
MDQPDILLASAVSYALHAAALIGPADLSRPTPCSDWDLDHLLRHLSDSMAALDEALATGRLTTEPPHVPEAPHPVELLRDRAAELLCTVFTAPRRVIDMSGLPLPDDLVLAAGAVEIVVHGWDLYVASGHGRAVPPAVARPLIRVLGRLVTERHGLFASPVATPRCASPGDRLVAYLGRDPSARHHGRAAFPALVTGE